MKLPYKAAVCALLALTGCVGSPVGGPLGGTPRLGARPASGSGTYISHIVVVIQENRTFDDLFATFPGADGTTTGKWHSKTVKLREANLYESCDFSHLRKNFLQDYDGGKMDGFGYEAKPCYAADPYQYVNPSQIASYWNIAQNYVLADHMFQTQGSGSFSAHQDLIRGGSMIDANQTTSLIDFPSNTPWGCDAPSRTTTNLLVSEQSGLQYEQHQGPFPCSNDFPGSGAYYQTLRDLLDAKYISWKYYTPSLEYGGGKLWNAFDTVYPVRYGSEWTTNVSSPETNIFSDISYGTLPSMSWVVPSASNSDHPRDRPDDGPSWVASVVNAIGQSSYWSSTAIVVVWDDWGGFYDHEPPAFFDDWGGLGFRVPMLVISPYAKETSSSQPGYISHTQYEFGSILKFIEGTFDLQSLGTTDQRATSISDCFDFTQQPRSFSVIPSKHSPRYFLHEKPSRAPVDTE